jgi:hypothetical protein
MHGWLLFSLSDYNVLVSKPWFFQHNAYFTIPLDCCEDCMKHLLVYRKMLNEILQPLLCVH